MANAVKSECITCKKERVVYKCSGCFQDFCLNHLSEHNRDLEKELDELEDQRNVLQENFLLLKTEPERYDLIQQINQWENEGIRKIQQTAREAKDNVFKYVHEIELKLEELTKQLKCIREEKDFNEIILNEFKEKFRKLNDELNQPKTISIREEANSFINKLLIIQNQLFITAKWKSNATILFPNQFSRPTGIFIDENQIIYIADSNHHRVFQSNRNDAAHPEKQFVFPTKLIIDKQTNSMFICDHGNRRVVRWTNTNQFETIISNIACWSLAMDKQGYLYVSDIEKHEVRRWKIGESKGIVVAGGHGSGNRLDQLSRPFYILVDDQQSIYVSDCDNHRIMKWTKGAKEGIVIAGGHGSGNGLNQLSYPNGIFLDQFESLYIADRTNHRIVRWLKDAQQGSILVGGNGEGNRINQLNRPSDLAFDQQQHLYILDWKNDRLLRFEIA